MHSHFFTRAALASGVVMAILLTGCGGGDSVGAGSDPVTLTGLAATGAGIATGTVTARCVSGPVVTGTTDAEGVFTLALGASTAPCMVQVTGGTPSVTLYSYAQSAGRVNITPATDLVVSRALAADPSAQFATFDAGKSNTIISNLTAAKTYVNGQFSAIVGAPLALDPMTGVFAVGDSHDKTLDALGAAMASAGKGITDLRSGAVAGSDLTATVPPFLGTPASPLATANSASQITVTWTAVPGATGYKVFRAASSGAVDVGGTALATPTTPSFVDTGLSAATAYFYKVVASNSVATSTATAEVTATTSAASDGGGSGSGLTCDTTKFQSGASVANPTTEQLSTFAKTYTGSEGDTDSNTFAFVATGNATLVLNANGTATYNSAAYVPTSYCLETLSGDAGIQLVIHSGEMSHFDLKTSGAWSGYTVAGKVVTDTAYSAGSSGGNASTFGALAITGNAVGIQSAAVPAAFNPTAYGTHPTAPVSWSMASGNSTWYVTVHGDVITSTAGFGSWQQQAVLNGVESAGVSFDMPSGHITFTNVALPAFSIGQTGTMTLNGTLNVTPATGTAVVITGDGTNAAGSGLDAPAASMSSMGTMNRYVWNGGKGISLQVENYSNGTNTVTVTNSAGPSWRNLSPGSTVAVNTTAKTISFNNSALTGISPTTTAITLNGTLTLP